MNWSDRNQNCTFQCTQIIAWPKWRRNRPSVSNCAFIQYLLLYKYVLPYACFGNHSIKNFHLLLHPKNYIFFLVPMDFVLECPVEFKNRIWKILFINVLKITFIFFLFLHRVIRHQLTMYQALNHIPFPQRSINPIR